METTNTNSDTPTQKATAAVMSVLPKAVASTKNVENMADRFQSGLRWTDYNILPVLAWPVLLGFAAVGIYTFLGGLDHNLKVGFAIAIAAFIGFKTHK